MPVIVGVDMGTTNTKALCLQPDGTILSSHSVSNRLIEPQPTWAEQDPEEIVQGVIQAVRGSLEKGKVSPSDVMGVCFSAAMHSIMAVDGNGRPLTRAIIWADNRARQEASRLQKSGEGLAIYRRTGTPLHPMSPLAKLKWFQKEEPDLYRRVRKWISFKEYLLHRLLGEWVVDYSIASATGLFHLQKKEWDADILAELDLRQDHLSNPVPATAVFRSLKKEIAEEMGLLPGTPIIIGASDGVLANVGVGAVELGEVAVTVGTSGAIRTVAEKPLTDSKGRTFCYALIEDRWVIGGAVNNGGILLQWFKEHFAKEQADLKALLQEAEPIPPGAEGLLCMPFLTGERAPYWNADLSGAFVNIRLHHGRGHFLRAVLEGICYSLRSVFEVMKPMVGPVRDVRASGGFARSPLARQMLADVLGEKLLFAENPEASAVGAAALGLLGIGKWDSLDQVKQWEILEGKHRPHPKAQAAYDALFQQYAAYAEWMNNRT